jgi:hypothetical protein
MAVSCLLIRKTYMPLVGLKVIYMGVVGCPVPGVDFDGKILL